MTQMPNTPTLSPAGIDLRSLWSRKWLILGATLFAVALGAAYLSVAQERYEVKTRLFLKKGVDPTKVIQEDEREDRYFAGSQAEIIGSPSIIRQALKKAPVQLPPGTDDDLMTYVLEALTVSPVVNTQVLSIRYEGPDADEAVRFVEALVESYKEYLKSIETNTSTGAVELLAEREAELRAKLNQLEEKHAAQRRASPLIGQAEKQLEATTTILADVGQALTAVRVRHFGLQNQLAAISQDRDPDTALASTVSYQKPAPADRNRGSTKAASFRMDPAALSQNFSRMALGYDGEGADGLVDVEQQLRLAILKTSRARERLGELHPMQHEADAELAMWRQLRDDSLGMALDSLEKQLEIEAATEARLSELYESERRKAKELDDHLIQEQKVLSEIARTEEVYNAVFNRLTDSQLVNQALSAGRASVLVRDLDGPHLHAEQLWPQPLIMLPACALFGLTFGVLVAFGADAARGRPRDPSVPPNGAVLDTRNGALHRHDTHQ